MFSKKLLFFQSLAYVVGNQEKPSYNAKPYILCAVVQEYIIKIEISIYQQ